MSCNRVDRELGWLKSLVSYKKVGFAERSKPGTTASTASFNAGQPGATLA